MSDQQVPPLRAGDQFHAGIVSDNPAATMARLSESLGYQWGELMSGTIAVRLPGGDITIESRCWYSTTAPRLEIVQSHPGTIWTETDAGLHHFGYWVDDVAGTMAALRAQGYTFEAAGVLPDGTPFWAYLHAPAASGSIGPRLELVSRQLQPMFEHYFATGKIPSLPRRPLRPREAGAALMVDGGPDDAGQPMLTRLMTSSPGSSPSTAADAVDSSRVTAPP